MDELQKHEDDIDFGTDLASWVVNQNNEWRESIEANYFEKWDEYYRIWRGIWSPNDRERKSERSKLISPATQQAVESSVAELEEATFGRGSFFDIKNDDGENVVTEDIKTKLAREFEKHGIRKDASEAVLNAAVFGTGIAEIVVDSYEEHIPTTQADSDGVMMSGRTSIERARVSLRPIKPHNFRLPDTATCLEDALGCAIEEFVSADYVFDLQEKGVYNETDQLLSSTASDSDLEPDPTIDTYNDSKVKLIRYFGKVPTKLLEEVEGFEPTQNHQPDNYYTEAMVVVANDGVLLKAVDNPYLMNDRPVVAFQWDLVPGRFWGRGVCEKGYNPQKALDAELRQRRDAMALNVAPMLGVDANKMVLKGQALTITPGKQILTHGDPREALHPFRFGETPQSSYIETESLSKMVQMATGAVDSAGIAGQVNGEATAAGISMSLGAIIKRHKRTLINFQESFLIPFVKKAAYRYMQFDPDNYPAQDFDFVVTTSLGIMAREYEISQLVQLLQTMSPDAPLYSVVLQSIIDNMNLSNRKEMMAAIEQASQPNPQQVAQMEAAEKRAQELHMAQMQLLMAQAEESKARAYKYMEEGKHVKTELEHDLIGRLANINNDSADDFQQALEVAKFDLKEKETIAKLAMQEKAMMQPKQENAQNGSQSN